MGLENSKAQCASGARQAARKQSTLTWVSLRSTTGYGSEFVVEGWTGRDGRNSGIGAEPVGDVILR